MRSDLIAASPGDTRLLPLSVISEGYAGLRVANPKVEAALEKSLAHLGQLSPVVIGPPSRGVCELLDGFKRVRILRRQGRLDILAREVPARKASAQKSLMFTLHGRLHGLSELEEALIVQSLHREDGMSQGDIGVLLARHKSWVSRRIALWERLTKEVREHLVLGLLPLSVGRVLCQLPPGRPLPRGNASQGSAGQGCTQEKMLAAIIKHRLSSRECEALLRHLKRASPAEAEALLRTPYEIDPPLSAPHSAIPLEGHLQRLSQLALGAIPKIRSAWALSPESVLLLRQTAGFLERCQVACREALATTLEVP